jgi:hypothetical protein
MKRRVFIVVALVAFCLGVIVTRVFWDGRSALVEGDAAIARGDRAEAVARWRRAARWYAPGAPHVAGAYGRLEALAREAEAAGDRRTALDAWTAIRSSILSTRSFFTPYAEKLPLANERIAALMAASEDPAVDPGKSEAERKAWHLALLEKDEAPALGWTILALAGFAAWVGGGFLFAFRGIGDGDKLDRRAAARAGLLIVVGLAAWMVGLYLA